MNACVLDAELAGTVTETIDRHRMLDGSGPVLVAFSGGADSTALALVLAELGYQVVLGHVDHGLRTESAAEAERCRRVAGDLGMDFYCRRVRVDPPTQAEARRVRYAALGEMAKECGAARIATGHTRDDQAETVLLRLRRGGYGLGIPPIRDDIVRPLIEVPRSATERVCRESGVEYLNDPSNRDRRYRRVIVRSELADFAPSELDRLLEIGHDAARQAERVKRQVDEVFASSVVAAEDGLRIPRSELRGVEPAVGRQLLHRMGRHLGLQLGARLIEDVQEKVAARTGTRLHLPAGLSVWSEPDEIVMGRWPAIGAFGERWLPVGSRARLPEWGIEIAVERASTADGPDASRFSELADAQAVGSSVSIRQWRPGDRFRPLGGPGTKKLQDFFVDAKVPRARRGTVPIVTAGDRIIWVVGHRLDDAAKLTEHSPGAVRLSVRPLGKPRRTG